MGKTAQLALDGAILLRYINRYDFLESYLSDVGIGGFQLIAPPREIGERLRLALSFVGHDETFSLSGRVVWSQSAPPMRPDLPVGVGIEFDSVCKETLKSVLRFITSSDPSLQPQDDRRETRLKVELDCEFLHNLELVREKVVNLSSNGMYIRTERVLPEGKSIFFYLFDSQMIHPIVLEGQVIWSNLEEQRPGFGVQLLFESRKHKSEFAAYINRLSEFVEEE